MKKKALARNTNELDRRFDAGEDIHNLIDMSKATMIRHGRKVRITLDVAESLVKNIDEIRFMEEGMGMGRVPELTGGGLVRSLGGWSRVFALRRKGEGEESDERILGGGDFVQGVLRDLGERQLCQPTEHYQEVLMQAVKVLPKWQITIPKGGREKLKIHVGDTIVVEEREGEIVLKKGKTIFDYAQSLPELGMTVDEIREKAIAGVAHERK